MVQLLAEQNDEVKKVILNNALGNCKMVALEIQKDIVNCFAEVREVWFTNDEYISWFVYNNELIMFTFLVDHSEIYHRRYWW